MECSGGSRSALKAPWRSSFTHCSFVRKAPNLRWLDLPHSEVADISDLESLPLLEVLSLRRLGAEHACQWFYARLTQGPISLG
jgi:hypothetical protein